MTQIVPLICEAIATHLTFHLQTSLTVGDPERADVIKLGKFQDDPNRKNIYIAITGGDPEDPTLQDGITKRTTDGRKVDFMVPAYEIGGGESWWRRGTVQVGCYFIREKYTEEEAMGHAYNILGRIELALDSAPVAGLQDDYGEVAYKLFPYANTFYESGGPPKSYIWRGKILWQCLTEKP